MFNQPQGLTSNKLRTCLTVIVAELILEKEIYCTINLETIEFMFGTKLLKVIFHILIIEFSIIIFGLKS